MKSDFIDSEVITDGKSKVLGVRAKILKGSDTILFVNSHIQSFNVKNKHPFKQTSPVETFKAIGNIIKNIKKHKSEQFNQIKTISELAKRTPKAIICGDFNSMPSTYNYTWLSRYFSNAFENAGNGFGITYLGKTLFFLRIDHQFYKGSGLNCVEFREIDFGFSDHKSTYGIYRID